MATEETHMMHLGTTEHEHVYVDPIEAMRIALGKQYTWLLCSSCGFNTYHRWLSLEHKHQCILCYTKRN